MNTIDSSTPEVPDCLDGMSQLQLQTLSYLAEGVENWKKAHNGEGAGGMLVGATLPIDGQEATWPLLMLSTIYQNDDEAPCVLDCVTQDAWWFHTELNGGTEVNAFRGEAAEDVLQLITEEIKARADGIRMF